MSNAHWSYSTFLLYFQYDSLSYRHVDMWYIDTNKLVFKSAALPRCEFSHNGTYGFGDQQTQSNLNGVVIMKKIYRFVGAEEAKRLREAGKIVKKKQYTRKALGTALSGKLKVMMEKPDFAETLGDTTTTATGGGRLGGEGDLVPFTDNLEKLSRSTDDRVQAIVRNAPYLVTFEVPNDAVIEGASPLSKSEGEVLAPNNLAFAGLITDFQVNPNLTDEQKEKPQQWLGSDKGHFSN